MIYYAQSRDSVYLKIKLGKDMDAPDCSHSFNRMMDIGHNWLKLAIICFESEDNVVKYERKITLAGDANVEDLIMKDEGSDSTIEIKIPKKQTSYWPEIVKGTTERDVVWKSLNDYYHDELMDLKEKQTREQTKSSKKQEKAEATQTAGQTT